MLKGAVALEVRLGSQARATADVDFGLREPADGRIVEFLSDRLTSILRANLDDYFDYRLRDIRMLAVAEASDIARARVAVRLAGREFGGSQIDIALWSNELGATERIRLPGRLQFAGIDPVDVEVIALARHVAEKFHGMLKEFPDRENTRVRDLVDLVLLHEHGLLDLASAAPAIRAVWAERDEALPARLPQLPAG